MHLTIQKRNGTFQPLNLSKIVNRIDQLIKGETDKSVVGDQCPSYSRIGNPLSLDASTIALEVCKFVKDKIKSTELDDITAQICADKTLEDPEYEILAKRLVVSNNHKGNRIYSSLKKLVEVLNQGTRFSKAYLDLVEKHGDELDQALDFSRDYDINYFGYRTLEKNYLLKTYLNGVNIYERPQHLWMRVALEIHRSDLPAVIHAYHRISQFYYMHATPTLYNSGSVDNQLASCNLTGSTDTIQGMYELNRRLAMISKNSGGIGIWLSNIRASNSIINDNGGKGSGIIPYIKGLNELSKHVDQGGKRKGSIACFCRDTEVFTINSGVKKIQDVKIGDLVVTHLGRIKPVVQIHQNPLKNRKIYKLEVDGNKEIYVTGNHRFWSFSTSRCNSAKLPLGWNSVEQLKDKRTTLQSCYVSIPNRNSIEDIQNYQIDIQYVILNDQIQGAILNNTNQIVINDKLAKPVNRIWNITSDFANLIGIWLKDGYIRKTRKNGHIIGIEFSIYSDNINQIDSIIKTSQTIFGHNVTIKLGHIGQYTQIKINSHIVGSIFMELFGAYFDQRKLPDLVFTWPKRLVESLLAGLIAGDRYINEITYNIPLELPNEKLMNQLYHLCRNTGINVTFVKQSKGNQANRIDIPISYNIISQIRKPYVDTSRDWSEHKYRDDRRNPYLKITNIIETDRNDEFVYTLGVLDDHSYTVEGLLVENCYLEPWHADIFQFLELKKNNGAEEFRARDIFLALFINDIFMARVKKAIMTRSETNPVMWSLMCPYQSPGLIDSWGEKFETLYLDYEAKGQYVRQVKILDIWDAILDAQIETSSPYMVYKDAANRLSNQQNLGTIKSSNLCVSGDTRILTRHGQIAIRDLSCQLVEVWNGHEWSETTVYQTGIDQQLLDIELSNGVSLSTTPTHKFILANREKIDADKLQIGSHLSNYNLPNLAEPTQMISCHVSSCEWSDNYRDNLLNLRLELQRYGIDSQVISIPNPDDTHRTPDTQLTEVKPIKYQIELFDQISDKIEFCCQNLRQIITNAPVVQKPPLTVVSITQCPVKQHTYCFKESKHGTGIFNGVMTGNCTEILEVSSFDEIACCNLGSICLSKYVVPASSDQSKSVEDQTRDVMPKSESILPQFQFDQNYDLDLLADVVGEVATNLNLVIDRGLYPVPQIRRGNFRHRPIGIGVQGLADVFFQLRLPYESKRAGELNQLIAEAIYYGAVKSTIRQARERSEQMSGMRKWTNVQRQELVKMIGTYDLTIRNIDTFKHHHTLENLTECEMNYLQQMISNVANLKESILTKLRSVNIDPDNFNWLELQYWNPSNPPEKWGTYSTFEGSPASRGEFRFDLSNHQPSGRFDWQKLRDETKIWGWRNSLMVAYMPTASTAQITGNVECFEQPDSNIFSRGVLSGQFMIVNKYMQADMIKSGLWNRDMIEQIIMNRGSVQQLKGVTSEFKELYKTGWELSKKVYLNMARDRQHFIDQSQSMNLFVDDPTPNYLTTVHLYGWENGLVTGLYYLRRRPIANAQQFSVEPKKIGTHAPIACPLNPQNYEECLACQA